MNLRCFLLMGGIASILFNGVQHASAANDTWGGAATPDFNWSAPSPFNWTGGNNTPLAGDVLFFAGSTGLNNTNDVATGTSFNGLFFNSGAGVFNLYGNPIVLAGGITNNSTSTETVNLPISIAASRQLNGVSGPLVINGPITNTSGGAISTLTLLGKGTMTDLLYTNAATAAGIALVVGGTWNMLDGTGSSSQVQVWTNSANNGSPISIPSGGTFNYGSISSAPNLLIGTNASISVSTSTSGTGTMNMTNGTLTLGGMNIVNNNSGSAVGILNMVGGTLNIGMGAGFALTIGNNPVGGNATMNVSGGTVNMMDKAGNTAAGNINLVTRGTGALNINGGLVECAALTVNNYFTAGQHGTVTLNGGTLIVSTITNKTSGTANTGGGSMISYNGGTVQAGASSTTFVTQGGAGNVLTNQILAGGAIFNTAGFNDTITLPLLTGAPVDGGLTKLGAGTLTLAAANTYNGNTTIGNGTLALGAAGSISSSTNIIVSSGATFDVSAVASFSLASGQILSNNTSTAGLNLNGSGSASSGSGTISLTYASGTPSFTVTGGALTLSSSTTFKVNNTGSALTAGSYKIISAGTGGSVAGTPLPSVTVGGGGIAGGTTASLQITANELYLVVASATPSTPHFTSISISGTTLSVHGTNGALGGQYVLLSSTNVALPFAQWKPVLTNNFDGSGNISLSTNIINATDTRQFYILSQ